MPTLYYDVETSGLPDRRLPITDARQPHVVQFAAILAGADGRPLTTVGMIVKPDGWTIPPDSTRIHGIAHETALAHGLPLKSVATLFLRLIDQADLVVGHNIEFDELMMAIACHRALGGAPVPERPRFCTLEATTPICRLPPTERMKAAGLGDRFKSPKLEEAYWHFFGEDLAGAHDALVDVEACRRIHRHLQTIARESESHAHA